MKLKLALAVRKQLEALGPDVTVAFQKFKQRVETYAAAKEAYVAGKAAYEQAKATATPGP